MSFVETVQELIGTPNKYKKGLLFLLLGATTLRLFKTLNHSNPPRLLVALNSEDAPRDRDKEKVFVALIHSLFLSCFPSLVVIVVVILSCSLIG
jgi:hypothetical protein